MKHCAETIRISTGHGGPAREIAVEATVRFVVTGAGLTHAEAVTAAQEHLAPVATGDVRHVEAWEITP